MDEGAQNFHSGNAARLRPEESLARIGARQHRQVTTEQLLQVGWSSSVISKRVSAGRLHPVFAEVYSLGGPPQTQREWWMAATLTFGLGTRLSDSAAVELFGWLRYPLGRIHVTTPTRRHARDGITPHFRPRSTAWGVIDFIPVTSPEQTILDCASTMENDKLFKRIIRQAEAEKSTTHARLLLFSARNAGARGVSRLRRELAHGPSPARSANEDRVLDLLRSTGTILSNHDIDGDEVDLYLPEHNVAIEVDSDLHANEAAQKHDAEKQARVEAKGVRVYRIR